MCRLSLAHRAVAKISAPKLTTALLTGLRNAAKIWRVALVESFPFSSPYCELCWGRRSQRAIRIKKVDSRRWQRALREPHERLGESDDHYKYQTGHDIDNCIFWAGRIAHKYTSRSSVALAVCESAERRSQATRG